MPSFILDMLLVRMEALFMASLPREDLGEARCYAESDLYVTPPKALSALLIAMTSLDSPFQVNVQCHSVLVVIDDVYRNGLMASICGAFAKVRYHFAGYRNDQAHAEPNL